MTAARCTVCNGDTRESERRNAKASPRDRRPLVIRHAAGCANAVTPEDGGRDG